MADDVAGPSNSLTPLSTTNPCVCSSMADMPVSYRLPVEYKEILQAAPFGFALLGPDRTVLLCNASYEKMLGVEAGEIIGKHAPLPESERHAWALIDRGLRLGQTFTNCKTKRLRNDGTEFPATITLRPVIRKDGSYEGAIGFIADTAQKETERKMLAEIIDRSPYFIGAAHIDGKMKFINPAGQKLLGCIGDEQIKQSKISDYLAQPEHFDSVDRLLRILKQRDHCSFETRGRNRQTGVEFPLDCSCFLISDAATGEPGYIAAVARNITRRKRIRATLEMFHAVVEHSPDFIVVATLDHKLAFVNPSGRRKFGLNGETETIGTSALDCFAEEDRNRVKDELIPLLLKEKCLTRELRARNFQTGESFPALWTAFVIYDARTKKPAFLAAIVKDITEQLNDRLALQQSLSNVQRLLEENKSLQEQQRRDYVSLQEYSNALQDEYAVVQNRQFGQIVGASPALQHVITMVRKVAPTDLTVLITGETGTGKELVAKAIHDHSKRAHKPIIAINCGTGPTTLMEAKLFGYEKGAFTGALKRQLGSFELASGGTLFLDEVANMPLEIQAIFLRVLEEHTFERVGGTTSIATDVRIIAATNCDLPTAVAAGKFRQDLFYRLNAFPIEVPPLRERKEDIAILLRHFLKIFAEKHGKKIRRIDKRSMHRLLAYDWPGNIRELQDTIERAVIICDDDILTIHGRLGGKPIEGNTLSGVYNEMLAGYERKMIEQALASTHGRVAGPRGAAVKLQIPKSTLDGRIRLLGIDTHKFKPHQSEAPSSTED